MVEPRLRLGQDSQVSFATTVADVHVHPAQPCLSHRERASGRTKTNNSSVSFDIIEGEQQDILICVLWDYDIK